MVLVGGTAAEEPAGGTAAEEAAAAASGAVLEGVEVEVDAALGPASDVAAWLKQRPCQTNQQE